MGKGSPVQKPRLAARFGQPPPGLPGHRKALGLRRGAKQKTAPGAIRAYGASNNSIAARTSASAPDRIDGSGSTRNKGE